jgi:hypothetical protein
MTDLTIGQIIAKLRRDMPHNQLVLRVCDELERLTRAHNATGEAKFDRNAYQREYMRIRRAKK